MVSRQSAAAPQTETAEEIIAAINAGEWPTADLVRIAHAVAQRGKNTTSVLGQYGEELVAHAFGGTVASFDQKAYDVHTPKDGDLQVKTFSVGKRPGNIRSFTHDVVTVEVDPATAMVVSARRYTAADLYETFRTRYTGGHSWNGGPADRFERGWTIPRAVPSVDIAHLFVGSAP